MITHHGEKPFNLMAAAHGQTGLGGKDDIATTAFDQMLSRQPPGLYVVH